MDPMTGPRVDGTPRFEVHVAAPSPATRDVIARRLLVVAIGVGVMVLWPYAAGASVGLPLLFAWLGYRVAVMRGRSLSVRFFDDVLETDSEGVVARTPWEHIEEVKETSEGAVIAVPRGFHVVIPKAQLPADRRVLIDALPAHVRFEVVQAPPPAKHQSKKTVALWVLLIVMLYAVYQLMSVR